MSLLVVMVADAHAGAGDREGAELHVDPADPRRREEFS
jgi:hypothetical protein